MRIENGVLYEVNNDDLNPDGSFTFPEGVTKIDGAFYGCSSLTKINIPEGVTEIGPWTFHGCSSLTEINIPEGVTKIGGNAFSNCSSLAEINIPEGVTVIDVQAFYGCNSLTEINIPEGVTGIGGEAFLETNCIVRIGNYDFIGKLLPRILDFSDENLSNIFKLQKIVSKSVLLTSKDFDVCILMSLLNSAYETIGEEQLRKLLTISDVSEEDLSLYFDEEDKIYKECFESTVEIEGELGIAIQAINGLEKSCQINGKERLEFYKKINELVQNKSVRTIEKLIQNINPQMGERVRKLSKRINEKTIKENLSSSKTELKSQIDSIFGEMHNQAKFVYKKIEDIMIEQYRARGNINKEDITEKIRVELGETANVGEIIYNKVEVIAEKFGEYFEKNEKNINRSPIEILQSEGEKIGKGYIRKLLMLQSTKMPKEEFENWVVKINNPNITLENTQHKTSLKIKEGKEEELYKQLEEKQAKVKGIVTYNQFEAMFGGIEEQPYSKKFKEYFEKHREEMLSKPEYWTRLSIIHNNYDGIINNPKNKKVENWPVQSLLDVIDSKPLEGQRPGDEELASIALSATAKGKFDIENFSKAQRLFDIMQQREESSIPPVETTIHKKYRGRMLRPDDPLAIFIGNLTDCCQAINQPGEKCMQHSVKNKQGGVFVVEEVDEEGKVINIVAQSWVWRNKNRLCFDNIEQEKEHFEGVATVEESKAVFEVYEEAAKRALEIDKEILVEMQKEGKINENIRRTYQLQEVTVGIGYNGQKELRKRIDDKEFKEATDIDPEGYEGYRDSRISYIIAEQKIEDITNLNDSQYGITDSQDDTITFSYGKRDEIQILSTTVSQNDSYEYDDEYEEVDEQTRIESRKKAQKIELIDGKIEQIKSVEKEAFAEDNRKLQDIEDTEALKRKVKLYTEKLNLAINREGTFYIMFEEGEKSIHIPEMACKPEDKESKLYMQEILYKITAKAKQKGKTIDVDMDRDASQINWQEFKNLSYEEMQKEIERIHEEHQSVQRKRIIGNGVQKKSSTDDKKAGKGNEEIEG